jgi:FkbM family methyltransferase
VKFRFRFGDKVLFYFDYFTRKVFWLWFEVKRPKLRMFLYEMMYSAMKFKDRSSLVPSPFDVSFVETVFGKFRVRPRTVDMSNASPAFERRDVDYLLSLMDGLTRAGKKVLFLDVGADIGTFIVTVGNRFRDCEGFRAFAFEPADSSFRILEENVRLNNLGSRAELFQFPLYSEDDLELDFSFNPDAPGSSGLISPGPGATGTVVTRTMDTVLHDRLAAHDVLVIKMDVEGAETEVLKGAEKTLRAGKEVYLLVEDFVKTDIISFLEEKGAVFLAKLTPYNSFWKLGP